jgi:hypothetical protein
MLMLGVCAQCTSQLLVGAEPRGTVVDTERFVLAHTDNNRAPIIHWEFESAPRNLLPDTRTTAAGTSCIVTTAPRWNGRRMPVMILDGPRAAGYRRAMIATDLRSAGGPSWSTPAWAD